VNSTVKTGHFWLVIVLSAFGFGRWYGRAAMARREKPINFSQFLEVDQGNVSEVTITAQELRRKFKDQSGFQHHRPANYPD